MNIPEGFYKFTTIALLVLIAMSALCYKSYQMGVEKVSHQVERATAPSAAPVSAPVSATVACLPPLEPAIKPRVRIKRVAAIKPSEALPLKNNTNKTSVSVPVPTLALYKMNDKSIFQQVMFPYLAPLHQSFDYVSGSGGGNKRDFVVVETYRLTAVGANFTVSNPSASDATGRVIPYFQGISDGQVIESGKSVQFQLICPDTQSNWVNLKYNFKILKMVK